MPVRTLHRDLADLGRGYDHVVIDTGPAATDIIRSAVMAADCDRARRADRARREPDHADHRPARRGRARPRGGVRRADHQGRKGTVSARSVRDVLGEAGLPVLDTEIPLAEIYASSFGIAPTDLGAYDDLIKELNSWRPRSRAQ